MYKLFSERNKEENAEPDVLIYDDFPQSFRNQVFFILSDVLDPYVYYDYKYDCYMDIWESLEKRYCREKGLKSMGNRYNNRKNSVEEYIETCNDEDLLDVLDLFFNFIDGPLRKIRPSNNYNYNPDENANKAIKELNYRFKQHNLGYEFKNSQIIIINNTFLHKTAVKPTLKLLVENGFEGAEQEMLSAYEKRRKGDNKNAILEAGKAFESTMKTICDKLGYSYDKNSSTAKKLISILENNGFFPAYMNNHLTNVKNTLETGLPVVRNKISGHGQGEQVISVPEEYVDYALHLAATNMLFLMRLYTNKK